MPIEPQSITAACISLITNLDRLAVDMHSFVSLAGVVHPDLDAVLKELSSLGICLEALKSNSVVSSQRVPPSIEHRIQLILVDTDKVVAEIGEILAKLSSGNFGSKMIWDDKGADDILKSRLTLESHKASLEIPLAFLTLLVHTAVKEDTSIIGRNEKDAALSLDEITAALAALPAGTAIPIPLQVEAVLNQSHAPAGAAELVQSRPLAVPVPETVVSDSTHTLERLRPAKLSAEPEPVSLGMRGTPVVRTEIDSSASSCQPLALSTSAYAPEVAPETKWTRKEEDPKGEKDRTANKVGESEEGMVESDFEDLCDAHPEVFGLIAAEQEVTEGHSFGPFSPSLSRIAGQSFSPLADFLTLGREMGLGRVRDSRYGDTSAPETRDTRWSHGTYDGGPNNQEVTPPTSPAAGSTTPPPTPAQEVRTPTSEGPGSLAKEKGPTRSFKAKKDGPFFRGSYPQLSPPPSPTTARHVSDDRAQRTPIGVTEVLNGRTRRAAPELPKLSFSRGALDERGSTVAPITTSATTRSNASRQAHGPKSPVKEEVEKIEQRWKHEMLQASAPQGHRRRLDCSKE